MISLIKLTNGTEIVGEVSFNNNSFIVVSDPLQINYKQRVDMSPPMVYLHRYNPFSNTKEFSFTNEHVLNISEPLPGLVKYYEAALRTIRQGIDRSIDEELIGAALAYSDDTEEDQVRKAMLEKATYNPKLN